MGTSFCDVTMTLKQQEKNEKRMFTTFTKKKKKMHTGLHSGLH